MGLVISLANPQSANRLVIRINGTRYFFSTTAGFDVDVFLFIVFFVLRVSETQALRLYTTPFFRITLAYNASSPDAITAKDCFARS